MICLLTDLIQLQTSGTWRFESERTDEIREKIDFYLEIFNVLDRVVAYETGIDLEDAALIAELAKFASSLKEDYMFCRESESRLTELIFDDYLDERLEYYASHLEKGLVNMRAILMMCAIKRVQMYVAIRMNQLFKKLKGDSDRKE